MPSTKPQSKQDVFAEQMRQEKSWLWDSLALPRRSQRSNVFIAQTKDALVKKAFRNICKNGQITELFKSANKIGGPDEYSGVFDYNLQRRKVFNIKGETPKSVNWEDPISEIDNALTTGANIAIIDYVFTQAHADEISDLMAALSQDEKAYQQKSTLIVFTSNIILFNQTLREICYSFCIPASTEAQRLAIGDQTAKDINMLYKQKYGDELNLKMTPELVAASRGLNTQQTQTAMMMGYYKDRIFKVEHFTELKSSLVNAMGLQYVEPQSGFETIGGYKLLKSYIMNHIILPLRNPKTAEYYGIGAPKGIILSGPPGTGKTKITKAISRELGLPMIKLSSSDVMRGFVGESEQRQREITTLLNDLAPNVIDAEECEQLTPDRNRMMMTDSGVSRRITNGWLDWLSSSERKSLFVGNTNFLKDMDAAAIRPGRIDEIILVLPPDTEAREEIFRIHTSVVRKIPLSEDFSAAKLAQKTSMWNGAEIEQACIDAAHKAFEEKAKTVEIAFFEEAIKNHPINAENRRTDVRNYIAEIKATQRYNEHYLQQAQEEFQKGSENDPEASKIQAMFD